MKRLISEIAGFLGEPEPYEIKRKFLIKYPDIILRKCIRHWCRLRMMIRQ